MSFFKFEINTVEEAKIAKAMLDTYIKLSEDSDNKTIEEKKEVKSSVKKDIQPVVKKSSVDKAKKEVKKVETKEVKSTKKEDDITFNDIQNMCKNIVSKCDDNETERRYRKSIANIAVKYGSSKAIRDIDEENYPQAFKEIKKLLNKLGEMPY